MGEPAAAPEASFWTIEQLAERCGHFCWVERRLFELAGSRASALGPAGSDPSGQGDAGDAEIRLYLSVLSARHALVAAQWRDRLPVRAGVDAAALVVPPPGPAEEVLQLCTAEPDLVLVLGGLVEQVLPALLDSYDRHLARTSAVREAPVRAVLELAGLRGRPEVAGGRALLRRMEETPDRAGKVAAFGADLQRRLGNPQGVFPRARAS
jgi:hypothetical protein